MSRGGSGAPRIGSPPTPPSTITTSLCGNISTLTGGNLDSNRQLTQLAKRGVAAIQEATAARKKNICPMRRDCKVILEVKSWSVIVSYFSAAQFVKRI